MLRARPLTLTAYHLQCIHAGTHAASDEQLVQKVRLEVTLYTRMIPLGKTSVEKE